jgi:3,4-dihydroxy 2-butanone 4-phosphate synthase / GTP cyclohydrolase II
LPTRYGEFKVLAYASDIEAGEHLALVMGVMRSSGPVLVRLDCECATGEIFGSLRCDCGQQLKQALETIAKAKRGAIIFLRQEGRGIGLHNKMRAYALQDRGMDTVQANLALGFAADQRDYATGAQIIKDLGIEQVALITDNPHKIKALVRYGITVARRLPAQVAPGPFNRAYLTTKKQKMGYL